MPPKRDADDGASEPDAKKAKAEPEPSRKRLRFAVVCASNQNRSMEAHKVLHQRGFNVESFGTGTHVKIPGKSIEEPNKWEFDQKTYDEMHKELEAQDEPFYRANGMLNMLDRNRHIKQRPERWQSCTDQFDVVVTCEARVYEAVVEHLESQDSETMEPVHVCNVEIKDNHHNATLGAEQISDLCALIEKTEDLENDIEDSLAEWEGKQDDGQQIMHSVSFY